MPATSVYQLPYPAAADPADVPVDMQELADRIEAVVGPGSADGQIPIWDNTAKKWVAGSRELGVTYLAAPVTVPIGPTDTVIVTAPAITIPANLPVMIEFYSPQTALSGAASQAVQYRLYTNGADDGTIGRVATGTTAQSIGVPTFLRSRRAGYGAGTYTWSIRARGEVAGNNTVSAGSGAPGGFDRAFIRVTRAA